MTVRAEHNAVLWRRLAAIFYDCLLLVGVFIVATAPLLVLTSGQAVPHGNWLYQAYLVALCCGYFSLSWCRGGQTLGMKAWQLTLRSDRGRSVTVGQSLWRCALAVLAWLPAGLGFWWSLVDRDRMAWHDRWSASRVVRTYRNGRSGR